MEDNKELTDTGEIKASNETASELSAPEPIPTESTSEVSAPEPVPTEITPDSRNNKTDKDNQPPKTTKQKVISELASWAIIIGIALILATLINKFVIMKAEIISGSMLDTLQIDDVYLGNRLAYVFGEPERGEIVFFKFPDNEEETFVKRVIGLPGEKLEIIDGKVYINDSTEPLDEPYLREKPRKEDFGPIVIPEDCYFMMGDNRNQSHDSRAWDTPYVTKDQLLAKAWLRIWPPFATADHYDYEEEN